MKNWLLKARNLFCYCGLTKEDYRQVKKQAYISNFTVWKYLFALMLVAFMALLTVSFFRTGIDTRFFVLIIMMVLSVVFLILFNNVFKSDSLVAQFVIYLAMIALLAFGLWVGVDQKEMMAVTFVVLLVILPMFMIDKPYFMAILLSASAVIFLLHAHWCGKPSEIFAKDLVNVTLFGVLGIVINTFYNYVRVREFVYEKVEKDYIVQQQDAYENTVELSNRLMRMCGSVVEVLGDVVDSRDGSSGAHIQRVKGLTFLLASQVMRDCPEYGLDDYQVSLITFASALHDVGKIAIPDSILLKPGTLSEEEFDVMKQHCERGCDIIRKMDGSWSRDYLEMGLTVCRSHHEKWDGSGYPDGLAGDAIPIAAQIVSLADIYDALTSKRVYKDAYSYEKAYEMILRGECGAFSEKILGCFQKCRRDFEEHAKNPLQKIIPDYQFEITAKRTVSGERYLVGLHSEQHTMEERNHLSEEISVISSLSDDFLYVCYVDMPINEVTRFKACDQFLDILNACGPDMPSNERFDKLLNTIIVAEDYSGFREAVDRTKAVEQVQREGYLTTDFRIRLEDGVHYCRMKITIDPNDSNAVIIGISNRDEDHRRETEYLNMRTELGIARREAENRIALEDRLAVINSLSSDYDYVCSLSVATMDVTVYHAEPWIRDMFKNLEDIVKSPAARNETLKGIIYPEDFARFAEMSKHENVMQMLKQYGNFSVSYRGYKYGKLITYQTRYVLDQEHPERIVIGLRQVAEQA